MRLNLVHFFTFCALLPSVVLGFAHRRSIDVRRADSLGRDWSLSNLGHGTLLPRASITDLEAAALGFIKLMQTIENGKYKQRQVLVVGGQAVQHWYPGFRETDVNTPHISHFSMLIRVRIPISKSSQARLRSKV